MSLCICLQLRREKEKEELLNERLGDSWLLHVGRTDGDRKLEHPYIRLIFPSVHLTQSVLTAGISLHLSLSLLFLFIYLFIYFVIRRHPSHSLRLYYAVLPQ